MKKIIAFIIGLISISQQMQAQDSYVQCEDTCSHIHGIDLSHYQGSVFWETVGENSKMAYVYLKATEGGDRIDDTYEKNIELAHRYGLKVGSYHFFRPKSELVKQLENFKTQCRPGDQDLIPMIDVESTGGLNSEAFCDSLMKFLHMVEEAYNKAKELLISHREQLDQLAAQLYEKEVLFREDLERIYGPRPWETPEKPEIEEASEAPELPENTYNPENTTLS